MTMAIHILTGEYASGGVGDYTRLLAGALAERGCEVRVWTPDAHNAATSDYRVHALQDWFGPAARRQLEAAFEAVPGRVLVQYVPNAMGARGANLPFCLWMHGLRQQVDVRVMFHEPYFYFGWQHPARNALAVLQRGMGRLLMGASRVAYFSTEAWGPYLARWASARTRIVVSPIPSTIPSDASSGDIEAWRSRFVAAQADAPVIGHFGTYGDHVAGELREVLPPLLGSHPHVRFACIGRGSLEFVTSLPQFAGRLVGTGSLAPADVASALRACDMVLQPYPDGVTTRRTSVMAALANGVPTVTTSGALTERVWSETAAVRIVPAADPHALAAASVALLRDEKTRTAIGQAGKQAYDARFALRHAVSAILDSSELEPVRASAGHEAVVPHR